MVWPGVAAGEVVPATGVRHFTGRHLAAGDRLAFGTVVVDELPELFSVVINLVLHDLITVGFQHCRLPLTLGQRDSLRLGDITFATPGVNKPK